VKVRAFPFFVVSAPALALRFAMSETVTVRAEPIELTQLLKFAGFFESGGQAKYAINSGKVTVNGAVETQARKKIFAGMTVACGDKTLLVAVEAKAKQPTSANPPILR